MSRAMLGCWGQLGGQGSWQDPSKGDAVSQTALKQALRTCARVCGQLWPESSGVWGPGVATGCLEGGFSSIPNPLL